MIFQTYLSIVRSRAFDRENCFQTRNDKQTLITSSLLRHKIIFLGERCRVKVRGRVGEGGMVGEEEVADEAEAEVPHHWCHCGSRRGRGASSAGASATSAAVLQGGATNPMYSHNGGGGAHGHRVSVRGTTAQEAHA